MPIDERSFGIVVAFVVPGWILLVGLSLRFPEIQPWITGPIDSSPTIGGFLYAILASIALGMVSSTIRWLVVDPLVTRSQPNSPEPDFRELRDSHEAMKSLVEAHYRFYQFHGNSLIAVFYSATERWIYLGFRVGEFVVIIMLTAILFVGAWDTKRKYDRRAARLLSKNLAET